MFIVMLQVIGQVHLIRGKIYEALMNRILASQSYKEALRTDIYCYEAFELLTQHQMLSRAEGK
jgi:anaphase-promoting complex subunit 6